MPEDPPLHICMMLYSYWPAPVGGAENQCRKLSNALVEDGCRVTVLAARETKDLKLRELDGDTEIRRFRIPETPLKSFGNLLPKRPVPSPVHETAGRSSRKPASSAPSSFLSGWVTRLNAYGYMAGVLIWMLRHGKSVDVLHVHSVGWMSGFANWLGSLFRFPVLIKESTDPELRPKEVSVLPRACVRKAQQRCSILVQTPGAEQYWLNNGVSPSRLFRIPNGVEEAPVRDFPVSNPEVLWVGNFSQGVRTKGLDTLSQAWAQVVTSCPDAKLFLVGGGDPTEVKTLLRKADALEKVEFAGFQKNLGPFFSSAWIFVFPSRREGLSNALLEAQSWGIPAVVSDIPGNLAVIEHGTNGLTAETENPRVLAEAILTLLQDTEQRRQMGIAAKKMVDDTFGLEKMRERCLSAYRTLCRCE